MANDNARSKMDFSKLDEDIISLRSMADDDFESEEVYSRLVQYLEWMSDFLENRRAHHKKHATKNALILKHAKEMFSADELQELDELAEQRAAERA